VTILDNTLVIPKLSSITPRTGDFTLWAFLGQSFTPWDAYGVSLPYFEEAFSG
jgi:hypothetical protein